MSKLNFKKILPPILVLLALLNMGIVASSQTWTQIQPEPNFWQASALSSDGVIILAAHGSEGGQRAGLLKRSNDGGVNWVNVGTTPTENKNWYSLAMSVNGQYMMAGEYQGRIYRSTDGGTTWTETRPAGDSNGLWGIAMSDNGQTVLAADWDRRLYKSLDFGATWIEQQPGGNNNQQWSVVAVSGDGNTFVAGIWGTKNIYVSHTAGASWSTAPGLPNDTFWKSADLSYNGQITYVSTTNSLLGPLKSTDGLASWSEISVGNTSAYNRGISCSSDGQTLAIVIYDEQKIYYSTNGGSSWSNHSIPPDPSATFEGTAVSVSQDGSTILGLTADYIRGGMMDPDIPYGHIYKCILSLPSPTIASFTPVSAGPGTTVTITGTNFTGATAVSFGGTAAASFAVNSAIEITAVLAAGASGSVSVTTPGGTGSLAGFTYLANISWTGATSTDWNTAGNWSTNAVPLITANVTIPDVTNDPIVTSGEGASCNNLAVSSGGSLTVQSGGSLITNGSITNNGSISIQRSVTNAAWHLVSAPTSNATANSFVAGDYLQSWSESTGSWTDITVMSTALNPVQGYGLWNSSASAQTYTFTGTPNTGDKSASITFTDGPTGYDGANLLGNPYPSSIDWDGLRTTYGAVYYWNGSAYVSWNDGGTGVRYIPPMQGFFVITASNTTFSLTNFNRTHTGATAYYKSTEDETMNNGLVLYADNGSYQDELYVSIENETQEGFELQNDAWKLPSNTAGLSQLWSVCTDGNLSIDRRPATDVIQLGFTNDVNGTYAIGLKEINGISKALIEDTKTGIRHDLMTGNYSFAWEANEDANRFKLLFNAVGIDEQASTGFSAYAIGKTIFISNPASEKLQIKLIDLMGRTVLNQQTGTNSLISIPTALNSGVYIIHITDGKQSSSTKVIIR